MKTGVIVYLVGDDLSLETTERSDTTNLQSSIFNSPINRDLRFAPTGLSGLGIINNRRIFLPVYLDSYRQSLCHIY
jgi:hypothetical protein